MYALQLKPQDKIPKYKQIVQSVIVDIERGTLRQDDQLPSISELSEGHYLARDTVEKAYRELRARGYITSVQGKGYYVQSADAAKLKILLVFNKLNAYKQSIYYGFIETLADKATVDLHIHHHNAGLFQDIIERNLGKYNYYVVMPHFTLATDPAQYLRVLHSIPPQELVLLDRDLPDFAPECLRVFQDFDHGINEALNKAVADLERYQRMVMVVPGDDSYPPEITHGFRRFCVYNDKDFTVRENAVDETLLPGTAYVVVRETDLVDLVKKARQTNFELSREIGIISFNETPLKDLLNLTVVTTDFTAMGRAAAHMILENKREKVRNPFYIIRRGSL